MTPGAAPPEEPGGGLWSDEAVADAAEAIHAIRVRDGDLLPGPLTGWTRDLADAALGAPRVRQEVERWQERAVEKRDLIVQPEKVAAECARLAAALAEARERIARVESLLASWKPDTEGDRACLGVVRAALAGVVEPGPGP